MSNAIPIGAERSIRDCGFDEVWLQDQISENPSCLQLGDLELVSRERQQSAGGRLDLLLKDPQDDSMYEVEVMLGETDESHIIRTIEYWDRERRRWPQRQRHAVLVAESITRRFLSVIQLLSLSIPIIAVQATIVEAGGARILHFAKVMDTYEEPEDEGGLLNQRYDEDYWTTKAAWTLEAAKALLSVVQPEYGGVSLNFVKNYIAVEVNGNNYLWLHKRSSGKSLLGFWLSESYMPKATGTLDAAGLTYVQRGQNVRMTVDRQLIEASAVTLVEIAKLIRKAWME